MWYAYAGGNPISWIDPWGLKPGDPFGSQPLMLSIGFYRGDGKYYATVPQAGTRNGSKPSYGPGGYRDVDAYYHTHGQWTTDMNGGNDVFSPDDKFIAD